MTGDKPRRQFRRSGRAETTTVLPTITVVVRGIPGKHPAEMSLAKRSAPVGELGPDGQHEPLGEAVSPADTAAES